ncbi:MAG: tRNA uridine-5-carboxymethylaminomethyl(34) synthesis GTPase MnmE [Lachnospiraceae bacterium]|nr:tRNA uridine-5-carboxymethylaminomethyl(34) synthesis GTPase MnmE [Lachnospiraceae bacterium]
MKSNTIAAIATAMSPSGIGIVRISGEEAFAIAGRIFRGPKGEKNLQDVPANTIHYGYIYDGEERIDEVLLMVMKGPHSFTAEDTVEIDCHGGVLVVKRILETVLKYGASPAEPGEFTKRAFLNGRIDLSQAEAVIDLIESKNRYAMTSSMNQLRGHVSERIRRIREKLLHQIAFIEAALDDPEHISLDGYTEKLSAIISDMKDEIGGMIRESENSRLVHEGIRTVILGKPNVGKSSILNLLLGEERAIVTSVAGTTRDTLEEHLMLNGISLNLIDTAGIRDTEDIVEKIGVERARKQAEDADLILFVVDSSRDLEESDHEMIELIRDKHAIILLNKTDLEPRMQPYELEVLAKKRVIPFSAKDGIGSEALANEIQKMFFEGRLQCNEELYLANARQKAALEQAMRSFEMVEMSMEGGFSEDCYSIDLMDAYEQLGFILGESVDDDLVNEIFGKFCMGK